ncbi:MAG: hypothetical protein ACE5GX_16650 [Thermoanaerobaculia bacterium]
MADLLTHLLTAGWLPIRRNREWRLSNVALGALLPDIISNLPIVILRPAANWLSITVPRWLPDALTAFHSPLLFCLLVAWLAALAPKASRMFFFRELSSGGLLHIAIDLLQDHVVPGAYFPGFPISKRPWDLGVFHTEHTLLALPIVALLTLVVYLRSHRARPERSQPF